MTLRFPYQAELLQGPPPPSLPSSATERWRPFVPATVFGPAGQFYQFSSVLVDPGADDSVFPFDLAQVLGVALRPSTAHGMRWAGKRYPLRFGDAELELSDPDGTGLRWPAIIAFSQAPLKYPLLGICGCLEFFNTNFLGEDRVVEFEPNGLFPGTVW